MTTEQAEQEPLYLQKRRLRLEIHNHVEQISIQQVYGSETLRYVGEQADRNLERFWTLTERIRGSDPRIIYPYLQEIRERWPELCEDEKSFAHYVYGTLLGMHSKSTSTR